MVRPRTWEWAAAAGLIAVGLYAGPPANAAAPSALVCDGQPVTITGTDGDDVIDGTPGPDVIAALAGQDVIRGHGGDYTICGGDDVDVLRGGPGNDRLFREQAGDDHGGGN